jgi:hypothetical protein
MEASTSLRLRHVYFNFVLQLVNEFGRAIVRALGCVELARLVPQLRLGRSQFGFPLVDSFHLSASKAI